MLMQVKSPGTPIRQRPMLDGRSAASGMIMYFLALAADYDGTLAKNGVVAADTVAALQRLRDSGRTLIMVTGREIEDLRWNFLRLDLFDLIVAENGGVLYEPGHDRVRPLAPPPSDAFIERVRARGVSNISVGHSIVAAWEPDQGIIVDVIRELGLELHIIFNKGALMVLPTGVNKATGLEAALAQLDISEHAVVGVGDAENDHSFLAVCGCSAAVSNALPGLRSEVDIQLNKDHGAGVIELIDDLLTRDAALLPKSRDGLMLGTNRLGKPVLAEPTGGNVLITGPSRSGKSTFATGLTERMVERGFEFCVLDPEGDYAELRDATVIGSADNPPSRAGILELLQRAAINVVIDLHPVPFHKRAKLVEALWGPIADLRMKTGRPNWLVVDESHEAFPAGAHHRLPRGLPPLIFLTVDPSLLPEEVLSSIETVCAFGPEPSVALAGFCQAAGRAHPSGVPPLQHDEALIWRPQDGPPLPLRPISAEQPHRRHAGKYAQGDVGNWRSFYFRGPRRQLNVPAQNLFEFIRVAGEVDDEVWDYHFRASDYSRWFRYVIRDTGLARDVAALERDTSLTPEQSREAVFKEITDRYLPVSFPEPHRSPNGS